MRIMPIINSSSQCRPSSKGKNPIPPTRLMNYESLIKKGYDMITANKIEEFLGKNITNKFFANKEGTSIVITDNEFNKLGSLTAKPCSRSRYWCTSDFGDKMSLDNIKQVYKLLIEMANVKYLYVDAKSQDAVDLLRELGFQGSDYNPKALVNQMNIKVGNRMGYFKV